MMIELTEELEAAVKAQARAHGVTPEGYVRELLGREVTSAAQAAVTPLETGYGRLARYGTAPSSEEIDANRAEMFLRFGEHA